MSMTPKAFWPWVKTLLHSVFDQPGGASVHARFGRVLEALHGKLPKVAEHLETARADVLTLAAFPKGLWRQVWPNNPPDAIEPRDPQAHRCRRNLPPTATR